MKKSLLFGATIALILASTSINAQRLKEKHYPILKDHYGIRYLEHDGEPLGTAETNFLEYTGFKLIPEVYEDGYELFGPEYYQKIFKRMGEIFSQEEIAKVILNQSAITSAMANDLFIASKEITEKKNTLYIALRKDPTSTKRDLPLEFMVHRINGEPVLRCYRTGAQANIKIYYLNKMPIPGSTTSSEEYKEADKKAFYENYFDPIKKTLFEIKLNGTTVDYPNWETGSN